MSDHPSPTQIVARTTAEWVHAQLGERPGRVLDVGCAGGEVALALAELGHTVTAIDVDPEKVDAARALGVDAHVRNIADIGEDAFDAVLFAFSLHHVRETEAALDRARDVLTEGGRALILELDFDGLREATRAWAGAMEALLLSTGALAEGGQAFFAQGGEEGEGHDHGHDHGHGHGHHHDHGHDHHHDHGRHHDHEGHGDWHPDGRSQEEFPPLEQLRRAVAARFTVEVEDRAPYIHAFWAQAMAAGRGAALEAVAELERLAIEAGAIDAFAVRWVARRAGSPT